MPYIQVVLISGSSVITVESKCDRQTDGRTSPPTRWAEAYLLQSHMTYKIQKEGRCDLIQ